MRKSVVMKKLIILQKHEQFFDLIQGRINFFLWAMLLNSNRDKIIAERAK